MCNYTQEGKLYDFQCEKEWRCIPEYFLERMERPIDKFESSKDKDVAVWEINSSSGRFSRTENIPTFNKKYGQKRLDTPLKFSYSDVIEILIPECIEHDFNLKTAIES